MVMVFVLAGTLLQIYPSIKCHSQQQRALRNILPERKLVCPESCRSTTVRDASALSASRLTEVYANNGLDIIAKVGAPKRSCQSGPDFPLALPAGCLHADIYKPYVMIGLSSSSSFYDRISALIPPNPRLIKSPCHSLDPTS